MSTLQELFRRGVSLLDKCSQPALESKLLLMKGIPVTEEEFFANPLREIPLKAEKRFLRLAAGRRSGLPLAYVLGEKEFWSIPFSVTPAVLIPRPETELLVEKAGKLPLPKNPVIGDIGTGCGNLAVSLAEKFPDARIFATDISLRALGVAGKNARRRNVRNVRFLRGDLFSPFRRLKLQEGFDLILSNPPYLSQHDWRGLTSEIKNHEPRQALVAGRSGLEFIRRLVPESLLFLKPGGRLLFEIGEGQLEEARRCFNDNWSSVTYERDLSRIPRLIIGRKRVSGEKRVIGSAKWG